jgi:hypothetical protein
MPALASKDSEKALDYLANPDSVLTLNISKFIVTIRSAPSTRYGLMQELRSTFNWQQSPTPYSQIFTLTASHHPTALCANAGSLLELLAALQHGLAAQILESSDVTGNMSDHSIYLRVSGVYIHEITQGLLLGR